MKHTSKNNMKNTISSKKIKQKHSKQKIPNNKKKTKTNDSHFSTKTGTKSRSKPQDKNMNNIKYIKKIHKDKNNLEDKFIQNFLENKHGTITMELNYLKSIRKSKIKTLILKSIRHDLEHSNIYDVMRKRIDRTLDDEIIMDLNKGKLQRLNKNLYTLILSLHRINLPDDLIELITNEGLKLIVPETNIYKIIPDNLLIDIQMINRLECEYYNSLDYYFNDMKVMNKKKKELLKKYSGKSKIYYEFVECILMNKRKRDAFDEMLRINIYDILYNNLIDF